MTADERIDALEAEVKALRNLVEHIYFGGRTCSDAAGNLIPAEKLPETLALRTVVAHLCENV